MGQPPSAAIVWQPPRLPFSPDAASAGGSEVSAPASLRPVHTLDRGDFGDLLRLAFYGLEILTPGGYVQRERTAGRLKLT